MIGFFPSHTMFLAMEQVGCSAPNIGLNACPGGGKQTVTQELTT